MGLDIAIAGGGLLGRLTAWRLLKAGHKVRLYEAASFKHYRGAAATAAGMVSPLAELVDSDRAIYELGMQSLVLWPQWLSEMPGGMHSLFVQRGSMVVAHPQDSSELQQFASKLHYYQAPEETFELLAPAQLQQLEPALERFAQGILLKPEAHINNRSLLPLLLTEIQRLGGICVDQCAVNAVGEQGMETAQGRISADWHIDCRGLGAKPQLTGLRGVRGEVMWVSSSEVKLSRPVRLLHPRYKLYVVPKPNQQFIVGATEIESEDLSAISLQSQLELSSALYSLHPAFAEARVLGSDVNLRPAMMDNQPCLHRAQGYIRANGLYRHGYLLAPAMVERIQAVVEGRAASAEVLP